MTKRELAAEAWGLLQQFLMANKSRFVDIAASFGLTPGHMHALLSLDAGEPKPMRALADDWKCDASHVTWLVDRLEERGLAERHTHPSDRRVKTIVLTAEGQRVQNDIRTAVSAPPAELLSLPSADLEALAAAARKLAGQITSSAALR